MKPKFSEEYVLSLLKDKYPEYDFSNFQYKGFDENIELICPVHKNFKKTFSKLLKGGCQKCNIEKRASSQRWDKNRFIIEAVNRHGDLYDYSLVDYKNNSSKIQIKCRDNHLFLQTPNKHLNGRGCPFCSKINNGFKLEDWIKRCKNRTGLLYVVKCVNENESFIKIGITTQSIEERFNSITKMPYTFSVLHNINNLSSTEIWKLEIKLKKLLKELQYSPLIKFKGSVTECFKKEAIDLIKQQI